jgi:hypothetical protein
MSTEVGDEMKAKRSWGGDEGEAKWGISDLVEWRGDMEDPSRGRW